MGRGAYLLYPFVDLGVVPEAGSSLLLARIIGQLNARKVLMDPSPIAAEEAVRLNLATDLCDEGQAFATCMQVAERMSSRPRLAMAATKRPMRGNHAALDLMDDRFVDTLSGTSVLNGMPVQVRPA